MWRPYKYLLVLLHVLTLPLSLLFLLILFLYKQLVLLCAYLFKDFAGSVPSSSCVFLTDSIYSKPHSTIVCIFHFDGILSKATATKLMQTAYDFRDQDGRRCYPELAYHPVIYGGYCFWKETPNFKVSNRIHLLKRKSSDNVIAEVAGALQRKPFQRNTPVWDVFIYHNYQDNSTILFNRGHHSLFDGMSIVKLMYALSGYNDLPETFTKAKRSMKMWDQIASSLFSKLRTFLYCITIGFIDYLEAIIIDLDDNPLTVDPSGNIRLTGDWIYSAGERALNVDRLKSAGKHFNCSIAHLVFAGMNSGLEKYVKENHGLEKIPEGINYIAPLPLPGHPKMRFVNHWCVVKMFGSWQLEKNNEKVQAWKDEMTNCASATMPIVSACVFQQISGLVPIQLLDGLIKPKINGTAVVSNMVGPQSGRLLFEGHKLTDSQFFLPILQESLPLAIGLMSYNGSIKICLTADTGAIPDHHKLHKLSSHIYDEIDKLCEII